MTEFQPWPKTPRLYRDVVITEKIDGTNAAVGVTEDGVVYAQSRSRIITPDQDNHGFARWVQDNTDALAETLGAGLHFGEWWGSGIQRGYGLSKGEKRFSLFNTKRWADPDTDLSVVPGLGVVPIIYQDVYTEQCVDNALHELRSVGSLASPGFMDPEGICIFHTASRGIFKVTLDNDGLPKSAVA